MIRAEKARVITREEEGVYEEEGKEGEEKVKEEEEDGIM